MIEGDLEIGDHANLAALACVVEVKGALKIVGTTGLSDLTALSRLRRVGGAVKIQDNPALERLEGLQALERVDGPIAMTGNPRLEGLHGLSGLRQLGGLVVHRNALTSLAGLQGELTFLPADGGSAYVSLKEAALVDLDGLAAISKVSAPQGLRFNIQSMPLLADVAGLAVFAAVEGPLEVLLMELPALTRFEWPGPLARLSIYEAASLQELALPAVTSIRGLVLHEVPALDSLAGLSALRAVDERLELGPCGGRGPGGITDIHGLEALESAEVVYIQGNASLTATTGLSTALAAEVVSFRGNPSLPQETAEAWLKAASGVGDSYSEACENLGGPECVVGCLPTGE